jgi:hypothetical protein
MQKEKTILPFFGQGKCFDTNSLTRIIQTIHQNTEQKNVDKTLEVG